MKNKAIIPILLLFIAATMSLSAQNPSDTKVDTNPIFAEGKMSLNDFYKYYLTYPEKAASSNTTGTVEVEITIGTDGAVTKANVTKSLSAETNKEALRVINLMPKFTPALVNDKPVSSSLKIKVPFPLVRETQDQSGSKDPLYVIDGKIIEGKISVEGDDIKSIRVLKGKQATAKYGEKGKNGVIVFTTK